MVRYLPELGYEPIVLTGPGGGSDRWTPADSTLMDEIPPDTCIRRVPGPEPTDSVWPARAERWLGWKAPWTRWWTEGTLEHGSKLGAGVDLIYSWMQPYASAEVGMRVAQKLGKPWVADFGDPWAFDEMIAYPTRFHRRRKLSTMHSVLANADAIVMSTDEAAKRVRHLLGRSAPNNVYVVPNGFDARDFVGPPPHKAGEVFRVVHTGYLHTELGTRYERFAAIRRVLGGGIPGVDVISRSHVYICRAINRVIERQPELRSKIELHLVGAVSPADRQVASDFGFVRLHGYLPHRDTVERMRSADLLFLPMHDVPEGMRASIVPGKTYEYLASRTPILAAVPEGDARDLLLAAGNSSVCNPKDVEAMAEAISRQIERKFGGAAPAGPSESVVARYEYRQLASDLAHVFDAALS
jgi:glycosyltransferase involved in cell wall biosynthesis